MGSEVAMAEPELQTLQETRSRRSSKRKGRRRVEEGLDALKEWGGGVVDAYYTK